jgi:hypothetical protein
MDHNKHIRSVLFLCIRKVSIFKPYGSHYEYLQLLFIVNISGNESISDVGYVILLTSRYYKLNDLLTNSI